MMLRVFVGACVIVLLCAAAAEAQQRVTLEWNAAPNSPARVDGYYVYKDGARISKLLHPTQLSYRVTITAAVHVFAVTAFSYVSGESDADAASLTYYSDLWLPALSSLQPRILEVNG
jgi:hypothetical protein